MEKVIKSLWMSGGNKRLYAITIALISMILCGNFSASAESRHGSVTNEMIYEKLIGLDKRVTVLEAQFTSFKEATNRRFEDLRVDMNKRFAEMREDMNKRFEEMRADMNKRFAEMREDMNKRFEAINRRFEDINKRFEDINRRFEDINKRFEDINRRFGDINKRFEELYTFLWIITGIFTAIMVGAFGFAYWDRRTIIRQARIETVEYLEKEGTLKLLLEVLKERARNDPELAGLLRQFNIL